MEGKKDLIIEEGTSASAILKSLNGATVPLDIDTISGLTSLEVHIVMQAYTIDTSSVAIRANSARLATEISTQMKQFDAAQTKRWEEIDSRLKRITDKLEEHLTQVNPQ